MLNRKSLVVTILASMVEAQLLNIDMDIGGKDVDKDGRIGMAAASCMGTFMDERIEKTFFVGVAHLEGMERDTILGWGKSLCSNEHLEWNSDYQIRLVVDGETYETGQRFTCGRDHGKEMQKVLQG